MNGTGATINFDGESFSVDSTKLASATNTFISHLGTVSGEGERVVVGGVEFGVDSGKIAGIFEAFESELGRLESEDGVNDFPYPIKYNLLTCPADGGLVKISDYIPTKEEINNLFVGITNYNYFYSLMEYQEINGAFLAEYNCRIDWNSNSSFGLIGVSSLTPELQEMIGIQFTEPGLYATCDNIDGTLILDIPDSSRYSSDINEYGFLYNYEYYGDAEFAEDISVLIFREDGSIDRYSNGSVQPAAPAGTAIYSNNSIDLSSVGLGIGTVSSDGTRIDFETDSLIILPISQKYPV